MEKASLFIDYENVYYYLKNTFKDPPELGSHTSSIIRSLKKHLETEMSLQPIIMNAYADFERLGAGSLSTLYLMGIQAQNVLGTGHKNAADMQMCIDLMQILYTRPDITHFVLLAGDRDYIPVVQHLRRLGRHVIVSAFRDTLSGDLLEIIGQDRFLDISPLLNQDARDKLQKHLADVGFRETVKQNLKTFQDNKAAANNQVDTKTPVTTPAPEPIKKNGTPEIPISKKDPESEMIRCLEHILDYIDQTGYKEPGLTPLLRYLTDEMPLLANWQRKELIAQLERKGAITIASRSGYDYSFSVVQINRQHPLVQECSL